MLHDMPTNDRAPDCRWVWRDGRLAERPVLAPAGVFAAQVFVEYVAHTRAQVFGLHGAAAGLSLAYLLATIVVLVAFVRTSGQPARDLLPVPADLAFYVGLTRRVLATR